MHIIDWSSDVCCSDLVSFSKLRMMVTTSSVGTPAPISSSLARLRNGNTIAWGKFSNSRAEALGRCMTCLYTLSAIDLNQPFQSFSDVTRGAGTSDRKSVVEGKSVSVRVDLGGRG